MDYRFIATAGDRDAATPLPDIGGKGLFTEDIERALREGRIDLAVHSLKDLPVEMPAGLELAAVPTREDARDVLVVREALTAVGDGGGSEGALRWLPDGARVGTSSLRRAAQLRTFRPDLAPRPIRGNVDTRLRKLADGGYDALVLAAAGLRRLGAWPPEAHVLDGKWLPAPGQGALGLQSRSDDAPILDLAGALDDPAASAETTAERALLAVLEGGCRVPIAARARCAGDELRLDAAVYDVDGGPPIEDAAAGPASEAARAGRDLGRRMLDAGASALVRRARLTP